MASLYSCRVYTWYTYVRAHILLSGIMCTWYYVSVPGTVLYIMISTKGQLKSFIRYQKSTGISRYEPNLPHNSTHQHHKVPHTAYANTLTCIRHLVNFTEKGPHALVGFQLTKPQPLIVLIVFVHNGEWWGIYCPPFFFFSPPPLPPTIHNFNIY